MKTSMGMIIVTSAKKAKSDLLNNFNIIVVTTQHKKDIEKISLYKNTASISSILLDCACFHLNTYLSLV